MKLSNLSDQEWFFRLQGRRNHNLQQVRYWRRYYRGEQPLYFIAKILQEQSDRFPALTFNWSRKAVDTIDRRMFVEGFNVGGASIPNSDLWAIWQRNDLSEHQSENNVAALVTGESYMMVGLGDEGAIVTVESPETVAVEVDPLTRRTIAALKFYRSQQTSLYGDFTGGLLEDRAVLLLPGRQVEFEYGKNIVTNRMEWMAVTETIRSSPLVPVVRFLNNEEQGVGFSELEDMRATVDAANQVATNMMAAVEHHAVPRKWILGANKESFTDASGNQLPAWKIATGAVWINPLDEDNPEAKPQIGQFAASDLRNFHETVGMLARQAASAYDLSPYAFGFGVADNPASADGIRAADEPLIARVERHMLARGAAYERVMRLAMAAEGMDPSGAQGIETVWRNPATPTQQAMADAAVKMYESGLFDDVQALTEYGLSATAIKAIQDRKAAAAEDPQLTQALTQFDAVRRNAAVGATTPVTTDAAVSGA